MSYSIKQEKKKVKNSCIISDKNKKKPIDKKSKNNSLDNLLNEDFIKEDDTNIKIQEMQIKMNKLNLTKNNSKSRLPSYVANGQTLGYKQPSLNSNQNNNLRTDSRLSNSSLVPTKVSSIHTSHLNSCCSNSKNKNKLNPSTSSLNNLNGKRLNDLNDKKITSKNLALSKSSSINKSDIKSKKFLYEEYMPLCKVQNMLDKGQVVEGVLRINQRNFEDAYISAPVVGEPDINIFGKLDLNRAFNEDLVAVQIKPINEWNVLYNVIEKNWLEWKNELINIFETKKLNQKNLLNTDNCLEGEVFQITENNHVDLNEKCSDNLSSASLSENEESNNTNFKDSNSQIFLVEEFFPENNDVLASNYEYKFKYKKNALNQDENEVVYDKEGFNLKLLKPEDLINCFFSNVCLQKTGKVVNIIKPLGNRTFGGKLISVSVNSNFVFFVPQDKKVNRFLIPLIECPDDFLANPQYYENSLFIGQIKKWVSNSKFAYGKLIKLVGDAGNVEAETEILLVENKVDTNDFPSNIEKGLPIRSNESFYEIPLKELKKRKDLRDELVFTIDPATARDLDDALSIKKISNHSVEGKEIFEVGVHIADVSYFVKENLPIDSVAQARTTSIYCVQKVVPMLPQILCEKYCSLNPGEEKLTFSVFWRMNLKGEIIKEWFEKTVIKSSIKLSYENASDIINNLDYDWNQSTNLPLIHTRYNYNDIAESLRLLNTIAMSLRAKRFQNGSLEISKPQLSFVLDETRLNVLGYTCEKPKSTSLVEEFMLLANISVAKKIYENFPNKSLLRMHPAPNQKLIETLEKHCVNSNLPMNASESKHLQASMKEIKKSVDQDIYMLLSLKLLKTMRPAAYITTVNEKNYELYKHYALSIPIYTHFTSPIRRYPDIIVHRLLAAALKLDKEVNFNKKEITELVERCNRMKLANRIVGETSQKIFLSSYIISVGHIEEKAVVMEVLDQSFDCFLTRLNVVVRVYCNSLDLERCEFSHSNNNLKLYYKNATSFVLIKFLKKVNLKITVPDKTSLLKWHSVLV